jgi:hypothetical protein
MADHADTNKKDGHIPSPLQSLSNSTASLGRSPPPPALKMAGSPDPRSHRGSFAEQMRGTPSSPRASRQPSLTQSALQELLNNPPTKGGDVKFQNRDWKSIRLGEIVDSSLVRFAEYDTSVEDATNVSTHGAHDDEARLTSADTGRERHAECCPAPRQQGHALRDWNLRLQRPQRVSPPRSRPRTPRRGRRRLIRRARKEGT